MAAYKKSEMNRRRAQWAKCAIDSFRAATRTDREDALCDLLCDLMHYARQHRFNFTGELDRATFHFNAEAQGGDE